MGHPNTFHKNYYTLISKSLKFSMFSTKFSKNLSNEKIIYKIIAKYYKIVNNINIVNHFKYML